MNRDQIIEAASRAAWDADPTHNGARAWEYASPHDERHMRALVTAAYDAMEALIRAEIAAELAEPVKRITAALIANADRLDVPFTNAPELSPWTRSVKPALERLRAAVAKITEGEQR